jgi:mRNA interferase HigB
MRKHARARTPLAEWLEIAEDADWRNIIEAGAIWPPADAIKGTLLTCFNIGGNNFRLTAFVSYPRQQIAIYEVLTHAEYDKRY